MTIEEFITLLYERIIECSECPLDLSKGAFVIRVTEDMDRMHGNAVLNRKTAARILHQVLRQIRKETDEADIEAATMLKDLYDCHVCVQHIAQLYVKGIMSVEGDVFAADKEVALSEAEEMIERLMEPAKRQVPVKPEMAGVMPIPLGEVDDFRHTCGTEEFYLVDLSGTLEETRPGVTRMSLRELQLNPYGITGNRNAVLLFVCENGLQSVLAARWMVKHGFRQVYHVTYGE